MITVTNDLSLLRAVLTIELERARAAASPTFEETAVDGAITSS
jgi:hypothetical protein